MRTIRIKLYKFNELSEAAKQNAIDDYRQDVDTSHIYDEAQKTVEAFIDVFGVKTGRNSWLDCNCNDIDSNILELKGLRLRSYILNNFYSSLFKGQYFSLWSKTETSYKYYEEGHPVLKSRHSKVMFDNCCTLTGVCYDLSMLQPVYDFLQYKDKPDYYSYIDFETLMNDCFSSLEKDLQSEEEAMQQDDYIIEAIQANEYEFTKEGKLV